MRLLKVDELEPEEFHGENIPPYAILSHTWEDDEITLQDLRHVCGSNKNRNDRVSTRVLGRKGYLKVRATANLAIKNGLKYVWVDTCCIDKTSSAELTEAINSMYQWYQRASACYVFLTDVPNRAGLSSSRWFTRGWTLQELIAPSDVDFFA
ncbi:hypothetical protein OQA88_10561 [Cercophora sp. LCS_1]